MQRQCFKAVSLWSRRMTFEKTHVKCKVKQIKLSLRYKQPQNNWELKSRRNQNKALELYSQWAPLKSSPCKNMLFIKSSYSWNGVRLMLLLIFVRDFHFVLWPLEHLCVERKCSKERRKQGRINSGLAGRQIYSEGRVTESLLKRPFSAQLYHQIWHHSYQVERPHMRKW